MEQFNVGIVGSGYVGPVTGACLSHVGYRVMCIDKEEGRICALKEGRMPFYEPGLKELLLRSVHQKRLSFLIRVAFIPSSGRPTQSL